jgi:D-3-phosphoglycerate dehydrogenase
MARWRFFAANYNQGAMWVYENLQQWLAERDVDFVLANCSSEDEIIQSAKKADIYLAFRFKVTRKVISALPRLKLIMSSGIGYDHIDVQAATDHGIVVTNTALYNVVDVVEHALALILACGRKLHVLNDLARQGRWEGGAPVQPIHRFGEQTIGIIGFGNIGRTLAQKTKTLGFQVLAFDPYVPIGEMPQMGVAPVDLKELLVLLCQFNLGQN